MIDEEILSQQETVEDAVLEATIQGKQVEHPQEQQKKSDEETIQQRNFRRLREDAERITRERDEALRLAESYKKQIRPMTEQETKYNLAPDDIVEGKHYNHQEQEISDLKRELHVTTTQLRLKAEFPDFARVVTKENIEELKRVDPDIARVLETSNDLEATARIAYKAIKKDVISQQQDPYIDDKLRAQVNAAKPRSLASVSPQQGDSPLSRANAFANGLTDELKHQLLKEMTDARKAL